MNHHRAIIVTGSRYLNDSEIVMPRLQSYGAGAVIIHGDCPPHVDAKGRRVPGADQIAHSLALILGQVPVPVPADWDRLGDKAGPIRNAEMLRILIAYQRHGYSIAVEAFPLPGSKGTWSMVHLARKECVAVRINESEG